VHDLQLVAILDDHLGQGRAGHDLKVPLHRDLLWHEAQLACQRGKAQPLAHTPMLAVYPDRNHAVDAHGC
jgi:hypothetical protein